MRLRQHFHQYRAAVPHMIELGRKRALFLAQDPLGIQFRLDWSGLSDLTCRFLHEVVAGGQSALVESLCLSRMFADGMKSFELPTRSLEAFENYDLNVLCEDYHQPFPTFVLDLPEDYARARAVPFEFEQETPLFAVFHWEPEVRSLHAIIVLDNGMSLTWHLMLTSGTIEERLREQVQGQLTGLRQSQEEGAMAEAVLRTGLNVALMATHYGTRSLGAENQGHLERTQTRLLKARKRGDANMVRCNETELALLPLRFCFQQSVQLFREERQPGEPGQPTGRRVRSHWRKGFWRRQRVGVGRSGVKLVAIPSVLVNADLLVGEPSLSGATYRG
jgi:hypothetical protein